MMNMQQQKGLSNEHRAEVAAIAKQQAMLMMQQQFVNPSTSFGLNKVSPHNHDGVSNLKISQDNIILPTMVSGTIDMFEQKTYTLYLTGQGPTPTRVDFYGEVYGDYISSGGFYNNHAMLNGVAFIRKNGIREFEPNNSSSVIPSKIENIAQGCNTFVYNTGLASAITENDSSRIIYMAYPSITKADILASGRVMSVSNNAVVIYIDVLASGYHISGFWAVS